MGKLAKILFWIVGWVSGGGICAFTTMGVIESIFGTGFNTSFVGGCLWGTFGVYAGRFMAQQVNTKEQPHEH